VRTIGEGAIAEQAVDLFIDAEYSNILTEAEVSPGAAGTLESVDGLNPFKLTFRVPLAPEVDLGDYHAVRLPYKWQAPGEKEVEEALENLRQMYATTETVERETQVGDYVLLDVESETTELNRKGFAAFVRSEDRDTEWPYNGFAKELVGFEDRRIRTIQHTFPEDWEVDELKGKSVDVKATIKTVRGVTLPTSTTNWQRWRVRAKLWMRSEKWSRRMLRCVHRMSMTTNILSNSSKKIKEGARLSIMPAPSNTRANMFCQTCPTAWRNRIWTWNLFQGARNHPRKIH